MRPWRVLDKLTLVLVFSVTPSVPITWAADGDFFPDGFVDLSDYSVLSICLSISGPVSHLAITDCREAFDFDDDGDVDVADFARFQLAVQKHAPIPLRDSQGIVLTLNATQPYSGRQTCGTMNCHDIDRIANGLVFQQGRTNAHGTVIMKDDFYDDGRPWVRGSGMYGRWSGGGGGLNRQTAGKTNLDESSIDMTTFYWAYNCGGCHAGGGGMEFDRDEMRLWDKTTESFGYEQLGKDASDVVLDGDYTALDDRDGSLYPAPWDVTGVAEPECLHCHRANRNYVALQDMHREWRAAVLAATTSLVDAAGLPVPAFASAGTAGQGWFSLLDSAASPPVLQIDYSVGVNAHELEVNSDNELALSRDFLIRPPTDQACWGCHLPGGFQGKRGTLWFDERDVHFKKFTNRSDADPKNDIADNRAAACNKCHPNDLDHNFAKGDSPYARFRNELDWVEFRSCRECHLWDHPDREPDAPEVGGGTDSIAVHLAGDPDAGPMAVLSCQACHVPYPLSPANIVTDRSVSGGDIFYETSEFLSADPVHPNADNTSTWYPNLRFKVDSDGRSRLFPQKSEVAVYWADWDQKGTPADLSDDSIRPIILWRVRQITGGSALAGVTDDNADGKLEVNRPEEILTYIRALKGNDRYGRQVAANPVLVKGERVWYENLDTPDPNDVIFFEHAGTGIFVESFETFGLDHNVLVQEEAWGYDSIFVLKDGCDDCHRSDGLSPVFDRQILVDPFGVDENATPVYRTIRDMTGLHPEIHGP